jgi:hypothetical protein
MTTKQASAVIDYTRRLVKGKIEVEALSYRQTELLCMVSSATLCRFLKGRTIDAVTFLKFCEWLKP